MPQRRTSLFKIYVVQGSNKNLANRELAYNYWNKLCVIYFRLWRNCNIFSYFAGTIRNSFISQNCFHNHMATKTCVIKYAILMCDVIASNCNVLCWQSECTLRIINYTMRIIWPGYLNTCNSSNLSGLFPQRWKVI